MSERVKFLLKRAVEGCRGVWVHCTLFSLVLVFPLYLDESAHREDVRGAGAPRGRVAV